VVVVVEVEDGDRCDKITGRGEGGKKGKGKRKRKGGRRFRRLQCT